jgi:thiamine pyrophosphate-dependent acetolactate synthase large subunit-like protein
MIDNTDAVRLLDSKRDGAVIVPTMNAGNVHMGLPSVSTHDELDFPLSGCMGKASSVGLGLALAHPERKIMILDGDGSLLMNLGTLVTLSNKAPENLVHFLFDNGVYAVTGGQPVPGAGRADWKKLAEGAGYAATFSFDNLEDLTTGIDQVLAAKGPVFVHLEVTPEIENTPVQFRQGARRTVHTAIRELPEAIGKG